MNQYDRYLDLQKQGFMKPLKTKKKKKEKKIIFVSCPQCYDWHEKGKHTAGKDERKKNLKNWRALHAKKQRATQVANYLINFADV